MTSGHTNFNSWMAVQSKSHFQAGSLKKGPDWQKRTTTPEWGNWRGQVMCKTKLFIPDNHTTWWTAGHSTQVLQRCSASPALPRKRIRASRQPAFQPAAPLQTASQSCLFSSSLCCPHFWCGMPRRGAPMSSTRWTARTDATRSGAAGRSAAHGPSWTTAAVVRSVRRAEGSTATAPCRGCTGWSADRVYSASSTRTRTITGTNTGSAKVRSHATFRSACGGLFLPVGCILTIWCPAAPKAACYHSVLGCVYWTITSDSSCIIAMEVSV